ncbi:MAG: hypothetical protein RLZZ597_1074 [Cyanobacteriota bacterium]|jgi:hypothetical protein
MGFLARTRRPVRSPTIRVIDDVCERRRIIDYKPVPPHFGQIA